MYGWYDVKNDPIILEFGIIVPGGPRSKLIDWRDPDLLFTLPSCEHLPTIIMTE